MAAQNWFYLITAYYRNTLIKKNIYNSIIMFYRSSSIVKGQMLLSKVNSDLTANNEFKLY